MRNEIINFPFVPGVSTNEEVGAKIKVIAHLAELRELANRGIPAENTAAKVEQLLCELSDYDISLLPVSVQIALKTLGCMYDVLDQPTSMAPIEAKPEYSAMFDAISQNLTLSSEVSTRMKSGLL